MPSLAYRYIKELYPVFWFKSVEMAEAIRRESSSMPLCKRVVQVSDWVHRATLDVIGVAVMGRDFGAIQDPESTFRKHYGNLRLQPSYINRWIILAATLTIGFKPLFQLPSRWNTASKEAADCIRSIAHDIIMEKKKLRQDGDDQKTDIASITLQSGAFSDENLVDQMVTFLVAGHETIASSLQWAVYALYKHPGIQLRLREEVRRHLPATVSSTERKFLPATAMDIDSLSYLNGFCNEVLRFQPPGTIHSTAGQERHEDATPGREGDEDRE